jgi:hypothetical protein
LIPPEPSTPWWYIPTVFLIVGAIIVPSSAIHGYIRGRQRRKLLLSGWTPLELIKREDFVISLIRRLIERLKRK